MDDFAKVYNKALRFLSYRQRSEKEVRDNLRKPSRGARSGSARKQIDQDILEQVINKLKEQKFLNDEEFARTWVNSRIRAKPRANRVIKLELKQKGITEEVIENLFSNPETISSDVEMARKLVNKKMLRLQGLPREKMNAKLQQMLMAKGFNWDTIKQVLVDEAYENEV